MDCVFWSGFGRIVFYVKKSWSNGMKNKNGELTTQQIVGLIILIASFSVILFLIFRLNLGETTDKEICHNSVLMKSKSVLEGALDCKTNYVCISGGGECEGINPTITKDIDMNPKAKDEDEKNEKIKNQIMKSIADEMADCWWMFGEGKIDYGSSWSAIKEKIIFWSDYHCAICSVVKFDSKIQEKFEEITYNEFYNFLVKPKDKTQTYLRYLYDVNTIAQFQSDYSMKNIDVTKEEDKIYTNSKYSIITGMKKGEYICSYFVKSSEVKDKTECGIFDITKA